MTFLDMVRRLGELTLEKCGDGCQIELHRREAAQILGCILADPELMREIAWRYAPPQLLHVEASLTPEQLNRLAEFFND